MKKKTEDQGNESPGAEPAEWELWHDETCVCETENFTGYVAIPMVGLEKYRIDRSEWISAFRSSRAIPHGLHLVATGKNPRRQKVIRIDQLRRGSSDDRIVLSLIRADGAKALTYLKVTEHLAQVIEANRSQFFETLADVLRQRRAGENVIDIIRRDLVDHWTDSPCFDWPPFCLWSLRSMAKYYGLCFPNKSGKPSPRLKQVRNLISSLKLFQPSIVLVKDVQFSGKDWTLTFHEEGRRIRPKKTE